jgi:hypothetical protein
LKTNGGYTLTPEGERAPACLGGDAAAVLAGAPQLLALKNRIGCEDRSSGSGLGLHLSILVSNRDSDPVGDLISGLFG